MILARRIALRPSRAQRVALSKAAGCARFAWNWGLARKEQAWAARKAALAAGVPVENAPEVPTAYELHKDLVRLKRLPAEQGGLPWLKESSKCAPQQSLLDLDLAYAAFFRRCKAGEAQKGHPRRHAKRTGEGAFTLFLSIHITTTHIQLPRIGRVRISPGSRGYAPSGTYKTVKIRQEAGRWFASVLIEVAEAPIVANNVLAEVGIDLGARKLAVLATLDGMTEIVPNRRALLRARRRLRAAQRMVSRRKKGSGRRRRAVQRFRRMHRAVANVRADMTHQATSAIACRFQVVALEDLKLQQMTRAKRGKGRAAKARMNRVVLDANLSEFRRQLAYKLKRRGGRLVLVDPAYTSQRCSGCGSLFDPGAAETYACAACGAVADRDANAARNILALARGEIDAAGNTESKNARGEAVSRRGLRTAALASMKRERDAAAQRG